ncbi:Sodium/potassium-transporting ATPase subunit beta-2 [Frankliniella fusca]|uniref:Sodium/potassium-transporting ATPase subunit beta-2 n=1 Tax=Frankliniella fusca TaxID=407009 RepID=A0AAE1HU03_9NEOP|nr:Sodium/potassium-transporting ATPase subunit beta-2 [Frankliniella fusca]
MANMRNGMTTNEMPYAKPEERSRWDAFRLAIYNPSTNEIFGRTCSSWAALMVFYSIFYVVLAAFFAICMKGMLHTIDEKEPYFTQDRSLIGSSPGLGFRPISPDVEKDGSLIWYQAKNATNVKTWTDRINTFLEPYKKANRGGAPNTQPCDFNNPPRPGMVCTMPMESWGRCQEVNGYGYNSSTPCVFVKLNKASSFTELETTLNFGIFGWVPEYYNDTEALPEEMPLTLKNYIRTRSPKETQRYVVRFQRNTVWVSCEGENSADKENVGKIRMYPTMGIPGYYFPYLNQEGYLSPVVAIYMERPTPNVLVNVECRAWAKNINYRRHSTLREGSVHFELMVD